MPKQNKKIKGVELQKWLRKKGFPSLAKILEPRPLNKIKK